MPLSYGVNRGRYWLGVHKDGTTTMVTASLREIESGALDTAAGTSRLEIFFNRYLGGYRRRFPHNGWDFQEISIPYPTTSRFYATR
jgi:hypothetical protein